MSEPQFTKGPWQIKIAKTFYGEGFIGIYDAQGRHTASAYSHMNNANLIAAAPEMYEALLDCCGECVDTFESDSACRFCSVGKALRKARGETE